MSGNNANSWQGLKISILVFPILVALFGVVTLAYAALYTIDTNDGSINEWETQGIAVFQTSPSNGGIDTSLDLKNMWVATSSGNTNNPNLTTLNFRAEMYGASALAPVDTAVAAILDCDSDQQANDPDDRMVIYLRDGNAQYCILPPFLCTQLPDDALFVFTGDLDAYLLPGQDETENHNLGQVVGNFVEWGTEISALQGVESAPVDYCQYDVSIRFTTATVGFDGSGNIVADIQDETPTFRGWDIPTAIDVQAFTASNPRATSSLLLLGGAGLLALSALMALTRIRKPTT